MAYDEKVRMEPGVNYSTSVKTSREKYTGSATEEVR